VRGLRSRWTARTGALSLAIVLIFSLGLSFAYATFNDDPSGEQQSSDSVDTETTSDSSPSTETTPSDASSSSSTSSSGSTGGGGAVNNEVVIRNTTDGRTTNREALGVAHVTGGDVTNTNSAAAVGACTDCRTVAIATQVVLMMGDSDHVAPRNQAVALNVGCLRCETYALAYQYVVSTGGVVRFGPGARAQLADLQSQIRAVGGSDLSYLELEAQVDALVEQMWAIVDEELIRVGAQANGTAYESADQAEENDSSTSPSPSADSASPEPAPEEGSPSNDDGTTTEASPSSEPSPTNTEPDTEESPTPTASDEPEATPSESPSP